MSQSSLQYVDSLSGPFRPSSQPLTPEQRLTLLRRVRWAVAVLILGLGTITTAITGDVRSVAALSDVVPPGHYLVLLQNNAEQRPSGGFLGTFATVDRTPYGYQNLRIDTNIYKRDAAFTERHVIDPPTPLLDVAANNRWAMRDSNWDLDFRDAAARVSWFYSQEGGEPVDGVIALNATVVQDLLTLTGPLPLPDSSDALSAETFFDTLHYKIEKEYFYDPSNRSANEPKSVIRDLIPTIMNSLTSPRILPRLIPLMEQELSEKQIQLYHTDPQVESKIVDRNWGGTIPDTDGDFLLVNNASVGGQKSSLNMVQSIDLHLGASATGVLSHTLTLQRTHTGDGVWPDHTNNNYVRIAVPLDASLTEARRNGIPVTDEVATTLEAGKTVFGIHLDTDPGTTSELVVTYQTAQQSPYRLRYQKQSGTLQEALRVTLDSQILIDHTITMDTDVRP